MTASFFCTRGEMYTDGYCYAVFKFSMILTKYYKADELIIANDSNYLIYYYARTFPEEFNNSPRITLNMKENLKRFKEIVDKSDVVIFYLDDFDPDYKSKKLVLDYVKSKKKPYVDLYNILEQEGEIVLPKIKTKKVDLNNQQKIIFKR